jgi:hypothetical protein
VGDLCVRMKEGNELKRSISSLREEAWSLRHYPPYVVLKVIVCQGFIF